MNTNQEQKIQELPDDVVFALSLQKPEIFSEIVDRYQEAFVRKAKRILGDDDDAYDVTQEAFVRIYSKARQYKKQQGASFKSWAYKILINQCFTLYQKKKKERLNVAWVEEEVFENIPDAFDLESYDSKLNKEYMVSLVSRLPGMLARVVTLHFLQNIPQKEVARIEGVSNEVVRARIYRAKKALQKLNVNV